MAESLLIGLTSIIVLGIAAEWFAWRLRVPSILLLLIFGLLAGPITGFLKPDSLFGSLISPIVSLAVAIILYEGGLSLRLSELRDIGTVVRRLVSIGALVTWLITALAAYYFLQLDIALSILLGAIVVVTGPTVIGPLMRHVRPSGQTSSILKWEGIVIDPIGAMLAVLVFEGIVAGEMQAATPAMAAVVVKTVLIGGSFGIIAAAFMSFLLRRFWIPDYLQSPFSLMAVLLTATAANLFQQESGLVSATAMGVILANQKGMAITHIIAFKENLRVLLISGLFILLAARLELSDFASVRVSAIVFLAILFLVARPLAVALSTTGSAVTLRERVLLAWTAPRGIVAAAVASIFALRLEEIGHPNANLLASYTFLVIIATVTVYGLTVPVLARWLKISNPDPQGVVILGAHSWARDIAEILRKEGFEVLLVDTDRRNIYDARLKGLPTLHAHILSQHFLDEADLVGMGRMLALTPSDEINSLAATHLLEIFGRAEVYQLVAEGEEKERRGIIAHRLHGRHLFGWKFSFAELSRLFASGARLKKNRLTEEFDYASFRTLYGTNAVPLFLIDKNHSLIVFTTDNQPMPKPGQTLISLVTQPEGIQMDQPRSDRFLKSEGGLAHKNKPSISRFSARATISDLLPMNRRDMPIDSPQKEMKDRKSKVD